MKALLVYVEIVKAVVAVAAISVLVLGGEGVKFTFVHAVIRHKGHSAREHVGVLVPGAEILLRAHYLTGVKLLPKADADKEKVRKSKLFGMFPKHLELILVILIFVTVQRVVFALTPDKCSQ